MLQLLALTASFVQRQSAGSNKEEKGKKGKKGKTKEEQAKKQKQKSKAVHRSAGGGKEMMPGVVVLHESEDLAPEEQQDEKVSSVLPLLSCPHICSFSLTAVVSWCCVVQFCPGG